MPTKAQNDRVLMLEGVHNFRDYGGYRIAGGGRLRRGWLWRSGQHYGATDADLVAIDALGITAVFDLRTDDERAHHPCRRPAEFSATINYADSPDRGNAPHLVAARSVPKRTPEATRAMLRKTYETIAFRPELQAAIKGYLAELTEGRGPSLINCMAGKDRTGIAVAMLHLATGVHRDDIMADYLLTKTAGDPEARILSGLEIIRQKACEIDEASARTLMDVDADYLETALAAIEDRYGTTDAFLEEAFGLDDPKRERLRDALVES
ncbi:tyrosine-protein phosphatase [Novosphingobium aquimarinum]|uniref:tyrosine-protein phosphatase n=1 Tax=Novosphingobium aquimarinum TaxID=2682494 RepID=UPI0012EB6F4D|nr:tyrosine-protein phosphatase [Novosphingobium aquimarinum]